MMTNLYNREWKRKELSRYVGHMNQIAGIKQFEAADGWERGTRIYEVWTGSGLSFQVLADRALDISTCQYKGMSLAWKSPVNDVHPAFYDAASTGWLRSFQGGLLVTCGLDTYGPPNQDGDEPLGQHGRVSNIPASSVSHSCTWHAEHYQLEIQGEIRQYKVFGENLLLQRRISTALGSNTIRIDDTVTNEGFSPHPHMILYHVNTGFPLLSEEARLKFEVKETLAGDRAAENGLKDWMNFESPVAGYQEQNFIHTPLPDSQGWATAELVNLSLRLGLRLSFDTEALPYLNQWKMMGEGLYVLGIEPMNCAVMGNRAEARQQNKLPQLEPGESRKYTLKIEVVEYSNDLHTGW
jgi:hypothetical protein